LVVIGDSGTGKSTLAFAAGRAGWQVLGDDMVVIDPAPEGASVRGIPRVPSVPREVADLASVVGEPLPDDARDRVELVGFELDTEPAPVSAVVVCGHSDGAGMVETLDPVRTIEWLVPAFVLSALDGPVRRWFPTAMVLGRGTCVELGHPRTVEERLAGAGPLLERAAALCSPQRP
jgi:hypothetical protein